MIILGTHNLERAIQFYAQGLGFPKMDCEGDIAFFQLNGTWLSVFPWALLAEDAGVPDQGTGFRGVALAHMVNSEAEVLQVLQSAQEAGAKLVRPAQKMEWGGFSGYFADPDGHLWEVTYAGSFWAGPR